MKVLMAAMQWDYGIPERGLSFEYTNLFKAMSHMNGVEVRLFDFMASHKAGGAELVNRALRDAVQEFDPDLLFAVAFEDELPDELLLELRDRPRPLTFNWFCDDHWRFESYTRRMAPLFNACSTTATSALPKYAAMGYSSVIKTQWACNHHEYHPTGGGMTHAVTFVGQPHGNRPALISRLRNAGLPVETWGTGWPAGRLTQDEMIKVFSQSRINLNLTNSSTQSRWRRLLRKPLTDQIKGRTFEIPGCAGFQLSGWADDIESYFEPGKEIALFSSDEELDEQIQRYLRDEASRASIAAAGYARTVSEHTYEHRYTQIFSHLGLM